MWTYYLLTSLGRFLCMLWKRSQGVDLHLAGSLSHSAKPLFPLHLGAKQATTFPREPVWSSSAFETTLSLGLHVSNSQCFPTSMVPLTHSSTSSQETLARQEFLGVISLQLQERESNFCASLRASAMLVRKAMATVSDWWGISTGRQVQQDPWGSEELPPNGRTPGNCWGHQHNLPRLHWATLRKEIPKQLGKTKESKDRKKKE